eukprot:TRINITY_DN9093_c0_g1_i1.p1 TRINITY_DN9093_c0_g1~~TRINITY_DN9093_c0_g1_i1.p1  ORF type:complete len:181 (-),score=71.14 TRINITY_DN9093_c0_g1_i1:236-778(-)
MGGSQQSRVLVLGIDGAGKTTFLNKVEHPKSDLATEATESYKVLDVKFKGVKFNVWDVSGKASTRSLWSSYYKEGGIDAIVWVVDAADSERLEESKKVLHQQMRDPELENKMLFVIANKQDLDGAASDEEVATALKLKTFEGKRVYFCVGTSAKNGTGVKEAMAKLAKEMKVVLKEKEKA